LKTVAAVFQQSESASSRACERARRKIFPLDYPIPESPHLPAPNSYLTTSEEKRVILWIAAQQEHGDCASPREVRNFASTLRKERSTDGRECILFTKEWWASGVLFVINIKRN
jgi:hypothetical protein